MHEGKVVVNALIKEYYESQSSLYQSLEHKLKINKNIKCKTEI